MNWKSVSISWVDLMVVMLFLIGLKRGQLRGISQELIDLFKWLAIVLLGGFAVGPLGEYVARTANMSLLASNVLVYSGIIFFFLVLGVILRARFLDKMGLSDIFGSGEYYLGTVAGGLRYICIILVAFSMIHARQFSAAELKADEAYQLQNYGSSFFPTLGSIQNDVFGNSAIGKFTTNHLGMVLIAPSATNKKPAAPGRNGIGVKARERMLDEVLDKR